MADHRDRWKTAEELRLSNRRKEPVKGKSASSVSCLGALAQSRRPVMGPPITSARSSPSSSLFYNQKFTKNMTVRRTVQRSPLPPPPRNLHSRTPPSITTASRPHLSTSPRVVPLSLYYPGEDVPLPDSGSESLAWSSDDDLAYLLKPKRVRFLMQPEMANPAYSRGYRSMRRTRSSSDSKMDYRLSLNEPSDESIKAQMWTRSRWSEHISASSSDEFCILEEEAKVERPLPYQPAPAPNLGEKDREMKPFTCSPDHLGCTQVVPGVKQIQIQPRARKLEAPDRPLQAPRRPGLLNLRYQFKRGQGIPLTLRARGSFLGKIPDQPPNIRRKHFSDPDQKRRGIALHRIKPGFPHRFEPLSPEVSIPVCFIQSANSDEPLVFDSTIDGTGKYVTLRPSHAEPGDNDGESEPPPPPPASAPVAVEPEPLSAMWINGLTNQVKVTKARPTTDESNDDSLETPFLSELSIGEDDDNPNLQSPIAAIDDFALLNPDDDTNSLPDLQTDKAKEDEDDDVSLLLSEPTRNRPFWEDVVPTDLSSLDSDTEDFKKHSPAWMDAMRATTAIGLALQGIAAAAALARDFRYPPPLPPPDVTGDQKTKSPKLDFYLPQEKDHPHNPLQIFKKLNKSIQRLLLSNSFKSKTKTKDEKAKTSVKVEHPPPPPPPLQQTCHKCLDNKIQLNIYEQFCKLQAENNSNAKTTSIPLSNIFWHQGPEDSTKVVNFVISERYCERPSLLANPTIDNLLTLLTSLATSDTKIGTDLSDSFTQTEDEGEDESDSLPLVSVNLIHNDDDNDDDDDDDDDELVEIEEASSTFEVSLARDEDADADDDETDDDDDDDDDEFVSGATDELEGHWSEATIQSQLSRECCKCDVLAATSDPDVEPSQLTTSFLTRYVQLLSRSWRRDELESEVWTQVSDIYSSPSLKALDLIQGQRFEPTPDCTPGSINTKGQLRRRAGSTRFRRCPPPVPVAVPHVARTRSDLGSGGTTTATVGDVVMWLDNKSALERLSVKSEEVLSWMADDEFEEESSALSSRQGSLLDLLPKPAMMEELSCRGPRGSAPVLSVG